MSGIEDAVARMKAGKKTGFGASNMKSMVAGSLYEKHLVEKGIEDQKHRGYSYFHPSAFGDCSRKLCYQYYEEKNPGEFMPEKAIEPHFMRICDAGHAFHNRMQESYARMGILRGYWQCRACGEIKGKEISEPGNSIGILLPDYCDCKRDPKDKRKGVDLFEYREIRLASEKKYNLQGNTDGIIELERGNPETRWVVDFKTINSNRFSTLEAPEDKYVVQVMIYMWLTGVHKSVIHYEEKDRHQVKEFIVPFDERRLEWIKKTALRLDGMLKEGKIPSRNPKYFKSKPPCVWCDFVKVCYKSKNGGKK